MNRLTYALSATAGAVAFTAIAAGLTLTAEGEAHAAVAPACTLASGWYVNDDEHDRLPTATDGGIAFDNSDLIHHATGGSIDTLTPGTFAAVPAPSQDSFFSVEVSGTDGKYGTLRWNTDKNYWEATSQGVQLHDTDPVKLADAFPVHLSHQLISFGVGFTANPPAKEDETVVVSSVTFGDKTYKLYDCATASPSPSTTTKSASPSASTSRTASPSSTRSSSHAAGAATTTSSSTTGGSLAVTGPSAPKLVLAGLSVAAVGAVLLFLTKRRKRTFIA